MQMILTLSLMILSSFTGSWRVTVNDERVMHFVVSPDNEVTVYSETWVPMTIVESSVSEDSILVKTLYGGTLQGTTFEGMKLGNQIQGKAIAQVFQYETEGSFSADQVSQTQFSQPIAWVSQVRDDDLIDVLGFLVEEAPKEDLEAFIAFWEEKVEPRYYIFLHQLIYGNSRGKEDRHELLGKVFESLKGFEAQDVASAREKARTLIQKVEDKKKRIDSVVIVPETLVDNTSKIIEVASLENPEQCCGNPPYIVERFLLYPISP